MGEKITDPTAEEAVKIISQVYPSAKNV